MRRKCSRRSARGGWLSPAVEASAFPSNCALDFCSERSTCDGMTVVDQATTG